MCEGRLQSWPNTAVNKISSKQHNWKKQLKLLQYPIELIKQLCTNHRESTAVVTACIWSWLCLSPLPEK